MSLRRRAIEGTVAALVELSARSITALSYNPTQSIAICPVIASSGSARPTSSARASHDVVILGRANRAEALRGFQAQWWQYPDAEGRVRHRQVVRPTCVIDAPKRFTNSYRVWAPWRYQSP